MHLPQIQKEVGVVAPEVPKDLRIFVEPKNSPTTSMVKTSESQDVGEGPRSPRRPRSAMRSSMRQKTATMKVLGS